MSSDLNTETTIINLYTLNMYGQVYKYTFNLLKLKLMQSIKRKLHSKINHILLTDGKKK